MPAVATSAGCPVWVEPLLIYGRKSREKEVFGEITPLGASVAVSIVVVIRVSGVGAMGVVGKLVTPTGGGGEGVADSRVTTPPFSTGISEVAVSGAANIAVVVGMTKGGSVCAIAVGVGEASGVSIVADGVGNRVAVALGVGVGLAVDVGLGVSVVLGVAVAVGGTAVAVGVGTGSPAICNEQFSTSLAISDPFTS